MQQKVSQSMAQQIVETVKDVCEQNINFIGTDGIITASTDASRIGTFHEIGKQAAMRKETLEVADDDAFFGTHAGVNIPVLYNGEVECVIGITGDPEHIRRYAYLAQKITILLLREQELENESTSRRNQINYVVQSLIDEQQCRNRRVERYLSERNVKSDAAWRTLLVELDRRYHPGNLSMIEQTVFQAFSKTGSELYTFHYPNGYLLILQEKSWKSSRRILDQLALSCKDLLKIGAGCAYPILEQYRSYQEAKAALPHHRRGVISLYEELGLEILCASAGENIRKLYTAKFLTGLTEAERTLLTVYYEQEMSLTKTGEALYLHKNTIQYQLDRIAKKTGRNPRKFRDAAGFYAALLL